MTPRIKLGLTTVLVLGGCAQAAPESLPSTQRLALEQPRFPRYVDYDARWVREECPSISLEVQGDKGVWVGERLFGNDKLGRERPPPQPYLPQGRLRGYCEFHWEPPARRPDAYRSYSDTKPEGRHTEQEDADVVSSLEPMPGWDTASELDRARILKARLATAERMWDVAPWLEEFMPRDQNVRVALVDNGPFGTSGEVSPASAPHVRAVANVVRQLGCARGEGQGPCPVRTSAHLAMPQIDDLNADYARGGYFGTRSQVARAIWDAVLSEERPREKAQRVVINLSLGWVAPDREGAADRAVRDAIAFARCQGHLVIAAAGNRAQNFDDTAGPLWPGAWESEPAPSAAVCERQYGATSRGRRESEDAYAPLVFAVGASDATDQPLASARPKARPPLTAHAHAVATNDTLPSPLELAPASGSSLATATVSAVAALVWSVKPELTAAEVMQHVYDGGVDLYDGRQGEADFSLAPGSHAPRPTVRRVSLCRSMLSALGIALEKCEDTLPAYGGKDHPIGRLWTVPPRQRGSSYYYSAGDVQKWIDTSEGSVVEAPYAGPQPTSPGCSTCRILGIRDAVGMAESELEVSLTPEMLAQSASVRIVVTAQTAMGTEVLEVVPPPGERNFTVPLVTKAVVKSATITFRHTQPTGESFDMYEQTLVE